MKLQSNHFELSQNQWTVTLEVLGNSQYLMVMNLTVKEEIDFTIGLQNAYPTSKLIQHSEYQPNYTLECGVK